MFNAPASTVLLSEVTGVAVVVTQVDEDTKSLSASPISGWQSPTDDGLLGAAVSGAADAQSTPQGIRGAHTGNQRDIQLDRHGTAYGGSNFLAADGHANSYCRQTYLLGIPLPPSGFRSKRTSMQLLRTLCTLIQRKLMQAR